MSKSSNNIEKSSGERQNPSTKTEGGIILFQTNVYFRQDKMTVFIQHLVDNYYAPHFIDFSKDEVKKWVKSYFTDSTNNGDYDEDKQLKVKLPLIAKDTFFEGSEEYKSKKNGILFYLPFPQFEKDDKKFSEYDTVDKVFSRADVILIELKKEISSFIRPSKVLSDNIFEETIPEGKDKVESETEEDVNGVNEAVKFTPTPSEWKGGKCKDNDLLTLLDELDGARKNEKERYNQLRGRLMGFSAHNPELERCKTEISGLKSRLDSANEQVNEYKRKLDNTEADKRRAVEEANSQNKKKYDDLKAAHDNYKKDAENYKGKWLTEEGKRKEHEKTIAEHETTIKRLNEESRLYNERVVFFRPTQDLAKLSITFFDAYDELMAEAGEQKKKEPSNQNEVDNYNYYLVRIERKFLKAVSAVKNLKTWRHELQMLAQTGLVPTGGMIDSKLGGNKVKASEWDSTLRMLLYHEVMAPLAGAAVVMCDEMAFMLPHQVPGVKGIDGFAKISERLQKAIRAMGYELNYVKPFTKLSQYKDVENVKFTEADVPSGTIFEVIKMALNYGSTKSKTEVSSKE